MLAPLVLLGQALRGQLDHLGLQALLVLRGQVVQVLRDQVALAVLLAPLVRQVLRGLREQQDLLVRVALQDLQELQVLE